MVEPRFNIGWRRYKVPPDKPYKWDGNVNVRVTKAVHAIVKDYAKKHDLELRKAVNKLIGIGLATEMGYTITNFHTET